MDVLQTFFSPLQGNSVHSYKTAFMNVFPFSSALLFLRILTKCALTESVQVAFSFSAEPTGGSGRKQETPPYLNPHHFKKQKLQKNCRNTQLVKPSFRTQMVLTVSAYFCNMRGQKVTQINFA